MRTDLITELQDLRYLSWSLTRHSSGTAGSFLKAYEETPEGKVYYKMSCFYSNEGVIGHECVNELIVDRLLTLLGIDHLHYRLIHALIQVEGREYETWVCASDDYKRKGDTKLSLEMFYQIEKRAGESVLDFCIRKGWKKQIYQMIVTDYLILNRDRHGANIEILRNHQRNTVRMATLFDHGLSLLFSCHTVEEIERADGLRDLPVQSFVGGRSVLKNLSLIPKEELPKLNALTEADREYILEGLEDILPEGLLMKLWEMIRQRYQYYETLCN
ncbi:MAG: hypothetical protein IJ744_10040 [Lachnospiraceae bacterium]|nr:hypothetical protein [Lachnospiraceae bacterium]